MSRWVDYIPELHKKILAQRFGPNDSQIVSAIAHPVEAINRGGEWFRENVSQASGGDPYDNPNPIIGPTQDEQAQAGLNLAGLAQLGGMPGAPSSAGGTLGTFIGPKAASWDKDKAALAKQLLDSGVPPDQVWKEHLIGRLPGGHLFSEIDDSEALLNIGKGKYLKNPDIKNNVAGNYFEAKAPGILKHDELYKNYPKINNVDVTLNEYGQHGAGQYNKLGDDDFIAISGAINKRPVSKALNDGPYSITQAEADELNAEEALLGDWRIDSPDLTKSTLLHEIKHVIQDEEGWPTGGSPNNTPLYDVEKLIELQAHRKSLGIDPEQIRTAIDSGQQVPIALRERLNKYDDLVKQEKEILDNKLAPIEAYRRLTGEAQARLTQDRIPLTMEQRREQYPLEGNKIADIPFNKLITRYGGSGDQRRIDLPETEFSKAHKIAQERAALPVEQGGLGLPPDNTPMDRAKALTYIKSYHGSGNDIDEFDLKRQGEKTGNSGWFGSGISTTDKVNEANQYAEYESENPAIYPLLVKAGKTFNINDSWVGGVNAKSFNKIKKLKGFTPDELEILTAPSLSYIPHSMEDVLGDKGIGGARLTEVLRKNGYDSVNVNRADYNGTLRKGAERTIFDPKNIRSRFAAFDPFNKDSANILASMIAGTTLLANQEKQEKSDKNIINSMAKKGKK